MIHPPHRWPSVALTTQRAYAELRIRPVGPVSLASGIALGLLVVLTQALVAIWFYKLFRTVSSTAAGSLAAFGLMNSAAILSSAAFLVTAVTVALDPALAPGGDAAATAQLMYELSGAFWGVGALFFGLWLIPMGYLVLTSEWMPRPLGWILIGGGVGYILSAFVVISFPTRRIRWDSR